jgi:hypothetical protein
MNKRHGDRNEITFLYIKKPDDQNLFKTSLDAANLLGSL